MNSIAPEVFPGMGKNPQETGDSLVENNFVTEETEFFPIPKEIGEAGPDIIFEPPTGDTLPTLKKPVLIKTAEEEAIAGASGHLGKIIREGIRNKDGFKEFGDTLAAAREAEARMVE